MDKYRVRYLILLQSTLLISLNIRYASLSRCIYQYSRLLKSTLLINSNVKYAPSLKCIYQYHLGSIIQQGYKFFRKRFNQIFFLLLGFLLMQFKPDTLICQGLNIFFISLIIMNNSKKVTITTRKPSLLYLARHIFHYYIGDNIK